MKSVHDLGLQRHLVTDEAEGRDSLQALHLVYRSVFRNWRYHLWGHILLHELAQVSRQVVFAELFVAIQLRPEPGLELILLTIKTAEL